jgi:hypothetical protein
VPTTLPWAEASDASADRPRVATSFAAEVPLGAAVGQNDGILVGLREVRCGVPKHEHEPVALHRSSESGVGIHARACSDGGNQHSPYE